MIQVSHAAAGGDGDSGSGASSGASPSDDSGMQTVRATVCQHMDRKSEMSCQPPQTSHPVNIQGRCMSARLSQLCVIISSFTHSHYITCNTGNVVSIAPWQ